ncbi:SatD family protein [Nonlabens agnitus]|uniref:SatD family (SatD) n=1 Tax=Nonlabens agnitus TaxID=870484 RepID=A0A2S9WTH4_9FLAO|nr:SatD family protein [Nonlabens agnitus]PRP66764.1 hypothetical protein BST86_06450 [Nonlabens agnitus]
MKVVIAGDIINSQQNDPETFIKALKDILSEYSSDGLFQIYRGDSFQALLKRPELGMFVALQLKSALKRSNGLDVRIAIGLGDVNVIQNDIAISKGSALIRSGQLLDSLKHKNQNLMVRSDHKLDYYMNNMLKMALLFMDNWTENAAEVIFEFLHNPHINQEELGLKLGIQQATVSRRLDRANWKETGIVSGLFREYYKDVSNDSIL